MKAAFTESVVEQVALTWLKSTSWQIAHGPDIAPDRPATVRMNCDEIIQERWLWIG